MTLPGRGAEFPDLSAYTIIVVDDDKDSLEVLAALLRSSGATVFAARTAVGALVYVDLQAPDVIITDLSMPQMDGLELVQRIRRHPTRHALPAIALTGFPEQYMDTKGAGFNAFLRKPVNFDELCTTIKRLGRYQRSP